MQLAPFIIASFSCVICCKGRKLVILHSTDLCSTLCIVNSIYTNSPSSSLANYWSASGVLFSVFLLGISVVNDRYLFSSQRWTAPTGMAMGIHAAQHGTTNPLTMRRHALAAFANRTCAAYVLHHSQTCDALRKKTWLHPGSNLPLFYSQNVR